MYKVEIAEGPSSCIATGLNNQGNSLSPSLCFLVCVCECVCVCTWFERLDMTQATEAKAGSAVSRNSNVRVCSFQRGF